MNYELAASSRHSQRTPNFLNLFMKKLTRDRVVPIITGPLADEFGESLGVWARHDRYKLGIKMFQKTQRMLGEAGITPQAVSPRLFLPILENASIEDDEDLHSRWAALLVPRKKR